MSCYRCGTRQVDPDRGESPWKRGVRADRQVLICPACQKSVDWLAELDHCQVCAGARLVRRLGEVECRDCGFVQDPGGASGAEHAPDSVVASKPGTAPGDDLGDASGLAEEVELALSRVLGRAGRPARIG